MFPGGSSMSIWQFKGISSSVVELGLYYYLLFNNFYILVRPVSLFLKKINNRITDIFLKY